MTRFKNRHLLLIPITILLLLIVTLVQGGEWVRPFGNTSINIVVVNKTDFADNATFAAGVNCLDITRRPVPDFCVGGGAAVWSLNGSNAFYTDGNVSVGTGLSRGLFHVGTGITQPAPNVLGRYRFETGSGSTAFDSTVPAEDGAITGATFVPSKGSNGTGNFALQFDGANDRVAFLDINHLQNVIAASVTLWVNLSVADNQTLIDYSTATFSVPRFRIEMFADNRILFSARSGDGEALQQVVSTSSLTLGEYSYVTATVNYGDNEMEIFINAVDDSATGTVNFISERTSDTASRRVRFGEDAAGTGDYTGFLDEIIIAKIDATQQQIQTAFEGSPGFLNLSSSLIVTKDGLFAFGTVQPNTDFISTFVGDTIFNGDVEITGVLSGGSPLKIEQGFTILDPTGNSTVQDLQVNGTIYGASPVKIGGGLQVSGVFNRFHSNGTVENVWDVIERQAEQIDDLTGKVDILRSR
ncbi:hypothetical protein LCGC14_0588990 [marine sediment metagenome]|uniref:LamG-like jellyroll fold domain-containing protein n=1 Tax=marine sediment metagenome TaxID=412755 RepID=A0A0F9RXU9_9ZZZZ